MLTEAVIEIAKEHAIAEYPKESVGIVIRVDGEEKYIPCKNMAEDPFSNFVLSAEDYAAAEDEGEIAIIMHSHPNGPARLSDVDRLSCEQWGHPFGVIGLSGNPVNVGGVGWGIANGWRPPLVGREFHYGILDCYTLIRDFYERELEIILPEFDHGPDKWWDKTSPNYDPKFNPYLDNFTAAGFVDATGALVRGDIVLMQVFADVPNHAGVLIDDQGIMLHHMQNRLSDRVIYGGYWSDITRKIVRMKGGVN